MKNKFFLLFFSSCLIGFNAFSQVEEDDLYFTMADREQINKRPIFTENVKPAEISNEPKSKFANPDFKGETTTQNPTAYNYFSEDFNLVDENYVFGSNSMNNWNNSRYWNARNASYYNSPYAYSNSFMNDPFYNNMMGYSPYNPYSAMMMSPYGYSPFGYSPYGYSPGWNMGMGYGTYGSSFGLGYGTSFGNPYSPFGLSMGVGLGSYFGNRYNRGYNNYYGGARVIERANNTVAKTRAPRGGMTRTGTNYTPTSQTAVNQLAQRRMYSSRIAGAENRSNYSNNGRYSNSNRYNYSNRSGSGNSNSWDNSFTRPTRSSNSG
eukprot:TRINITY_DN48461_c0_g1_i4.p1 TRINITY_DN48461_c0_g1~~TRINITY_DN48461_c0_g1_i4.p1  ORF type:complete len:354 (-),score=28.86 TRINITY_DN48461_c0_g1_i4:100-1062(-)